MPFRTKDTNIRIIGTPFAYWHYIHMQTVNFLAQVYGFSLVIIPLSLLINPKHISKMIELMENEARIILSGIIGVILGIILILSYNVWDSSLAVLITLASWAFFLKGIVRLFFPGFVLKMLARFKNNHTWMPFMFLGMIVLGCVFIYLGFNF